MSRQLRIRPTGGTVRLNGNLLTGPYDFDQQEGKTPQIDLVNTASCEVHRVPEQGDPLPNDTLCLRLHATGGTFDVIRARTRPMLRKSGKEFADGEMKKSKRELKIIQHRKKLKYSIHHKQQGAKLQITFEAKQ